MLNKDLKNIDVRYASKAKFKEILYLNTLHGKIEYSTTDYNIILIGVDLKHNDYICKYILDGPCNLEDAIINFDFYIDMLNGYDPEEENFSKNKLRDYIDVELNIFKLYPKMRRCYLAIEQNVYNETGAITGSQVLCTCRVWKNEF